VRIVGFDGVNPLDRIASAPREGLCRLVAASLRIEQGAHRLSDGVRLNRLVAVVRIPSLEQLNDLTAVRVIRFDLVDPFDGIATTKPSEVGHGTIRPMFKAAERATGHEVGRVSAAPSE
jgi:hypothetical protein